MQIEKKVVAVTKCFALTYSLGERSHYTMMELDKQCRIFLYNRFSICDGDRVVARPSYHIDSPSISVIFGSYYVSGRL